MKVSSFNIDHNRIKKGVYVSRKDKISEYTLTTFDIRMKTPNKEEVLDNSAIHTLEHLFAVFLRNNETWGDKIIYVGPMGCRTGMYLIMKGDLTPFDILELLKEMFIYIINFNDDVPAATPKECGNYLDHNLNSAKIEAKKFYNDVLLLLNEKNTNYPI